MICLRKQSFDQPLNYDGNQWFPYDNLDLAKEINDFLKEENA